MQVLDGQVADRGLLGVVLDGGGLDPGAGTGVLPVICREVAGFHREPSAVTAVRKLPAVYSAQA